MKSGWKIALIILGLVIIILLTLLLTGLFIYMHPNRNHCNPDYMYLCYFSSTDMPCTSDNDCSTTQLTYSHTSCNLSTSRCDLYTNKSLKTKEACKDAGGEWFEGACD